MAKNLYKNSAPSKILRTLLIGGGILVLGTIAPAAGAGLIKSLISAYFKNKKFERNRFLRDLKSLQKRELVNYQEMDDGSVKIALSKKGKEIILRYQLDEIHLDKKKRWDRLWRMIVFDIPHDQKRARDALREKLVEWECYAIQKSVFITPYECEKEIDFICSVFGINRNNVLIFYVKNFEGEEKIKHYFSLF